MKKIIALALALIMALSMASVAFAAGTTYTPGQKIVVPGLWTAEKKAVVYVDSDFTSADEQYKGASLIESIEWVKNAKESKDAGRPMYELVVTLKENLTSTTGKDINGVVEILEKKTDAYKGGIAIDGTVANFVDYIAGDKKADQATPIDDYMLENHVMFAEDGAGYVTFGTGLSLTGLVKVEKDEKAQVYYGTIDDDTRDAIDAYLGEDYDAIVEEYVYEGTGFKNDVAFTYEAYEEDPHFFYLWDGEKFVDLEGKYNDDEEVEAYEFTADAKGIIIVTDVEIVAAEEETKNPDTGANDVVGVAAALAVVSLVAAGAVSLKK